MFVSSWWSSICFPCFHYRCRSLNREGSVQGSGQSFLSIDSTGRHTPPKPLTPSVCMLFCKHLCASASWPDSNRTCHHLLRASRNGAGTIAATSSSPTELLGSSYHLHHPIPSPGPPRAIWKLCIVFFSRSPPVTPPELGSTHYEIPTQNLTGQMLRSPRLPQNYLCRPMGQTVQGRATMTSSVTSSMRTNSRSKGNWYCCCCTCGRPEQA